MSLSGRKKRREVNLYSYYDHAGIVRHLEELARQGWQLEHTGSVFWTYRRCEPAELHYAVVYFPKASQFDPEPPPEQRDFWALCKATGWELVSNRYQMQVFCNPAKNPTPIETDPVVQVENVHAAMKAGAARSNWLMLCCALLQIWAQFRNAETIRDLLSSGISLLAVLLWGLILMDSVAELIAYYRWSKRAAVAAREEGVLLSPRSHKWRRVLELSLIAVFCAAYLGTLLAANRYGMAVYTGLLLWFLYAALLSLVIHGSRYLMKKHGFPAEHNLLLSTFITIIAALVLTAGLFWVSLRLVGTPLGHPNAEKRPSPGYHDSSRYTYTVYHDPLPLTAEELIGEIPGADYSCYRKTGTSLLVTEYIFRQEQTYGAGSTAAPELYCSVYQVNLSCLYAPVKDSFFKELEAFNRNTSLIGQPRQSWVPTDAAPWGADEVYQFHSGDTANGVYLLCYPNRIVRLRFDPWYDIAPTQEQMALVGERLGFGSLT